MDETQNTSEAKAEEGKTFTQEDVNRIVADRLKRAKADAAEMDELRRKAAELDELKAASQSELERTQKAYADASAELERMRTEAAHNALVAKVSADTSVPAALLKGETEEELAESAEALNAWLKSQSGFPTDKGGAATGYHGPTNEQIAQVKNPAERVRLRAQMHAAQR